MHIENRLYAIEIDGANGSVRRILDRASGLELLREPRLAESFRLLLPLPELEANYILSAEQELTAAERTERGVMLLWRGPLVNAQGAFDLDVTMHIEFAGEAIHFRIEVANRSEHRVAEVWYPVLGGLLGLGERADNAALVPYSDARLGNFLERFPEIMGIGGGGGLRYPEWAARYPGNLCMPWISFFNTKLGRGAYFACHDLAPRSKALRMEMHPGLARQRQGGNWPSDEELAEVGADYPPGLVLNWTHFPYTPPGETWEGPPVVLQFHDGGWHAAAKVYRQWFAESFGLPEVHTDWIRRQIAAQDAMFLLPEGNLFLRYADIADWAKGARDHGLGSVLISGWDVGGHDNCYPDYSPDPRLGTWEELKAGVDACHEIGLRVYFFVNLQPVDCTTQRYRDELHRYRIMDPSGWSNAYGFGMGTLGARLGLTRRPLVNCNPAFPEFREIIVRQMARLAELGADGVHIDKLGPSGGLDFNPDLPVSPDRAEPEGVLAALDEILSVCRKINSDFRLSVESGWDRTLPYAPTTWMWHDSLDHLSAIRYTFPEWAPTFAVVQPWDYANVNNSIRFGYQLLIGPVRYTASLSDAQYVRLAAYIEEVMRLRRELVDFIDLGDFLDTEEVEIRCERAVLFNSHRNPATGARACVLMNVGGGPQTARVTFAGNVSGRVRIYAPFSEVADMALPAEVQIPRDRFVVVVEA